MAPGEGFDRAAAMREFDETKAGVKGLVEAGVTTIPLIFRHPNLRPADATSLDLSIPTVDLSLPRPLTVDLVRAAARDWGFFQVTNHGIPLPAIDATISAVRSFHELPAPVRSSHYSRGFNGGVSYASNFDLFRSGAASWRDTLQVRMAPIRPDPNQISEVCREELLAWGEHATAVGRRILGLMSEGLGVDQGRLEGMTCLEGSTMVCHYYPPCPEPDLTVGIADHTDPGVLTVLIQDHIGGLQVKRRGDSGETSWVDVKPLPGALVINVGDLLQIISNDEYTSVEHRVVANARQEARVSIAVFFIPGKKGESEFYGPLSELVSHQKPAHYRNFTIEEFMGSFYSKELASKALLDQFKLSGE